MAARDGEREFGTRASAYGVVAGHDLSGRDGPRHRRQHGHRGGDGARAGERGGTGSCSRAGAKLCNVLVAKALHARYGARGLIACALHPGTFVTTELGRHSTIIAAVMRLVSPFTKSPVQGAATSVYATVHEPASEVAGQYLRDCRVARCSAEANDPAVARRLWAVTERWIAGGGAPEWP